MESGTGRENKPVNKESRDQLKKEVTEMEVEKRHMEKKMREGMDRIDKKIKNTEYEVKVHGLTLRDKEQDIRLIELKIKELNNKMNPGFAGNHAFHRLVGGQKRSSLVPKKMPRSHSRKHLSSQS
jgi:predicted  nucleic acid-binding Zn-ribbon protein